jgi:hypothetical protein
MKVTIHQKPRIIVDVLAEIEGAEFDLFDLRELIVSLDDGDDVQVEEPLASQLMSLGILSFPGKGKKSAVPGPRFGEAKEAVAEAIDDTELDLPTSR